MISTAQLINGLALLDQRRYRRHSWNAIARPLIVSMITSRSTSIPLQNRQRAMALIQIRPERSGAVAARCRRSFITAGQRGSRGPTAGIAFATVFTSRPQLSARMRCSSGDCSRWYCSLSSRYSSIAAADPQAVLDLIQSFQWLMKP